MTPLDRPLDRPATARGVRTVGVAIAVPEPFGTQLQAHRAAFGDPRGRLIPSHITLLPPTAVSDAGPDLTEDVGSHLAAVAASTAPFAVHLKGTASFRPVSPVVFVPLAEGAGACEALQQHVRSGPLERPISFPYHPHVTVAHGLPDPRLDEASAVLADFECWFEVGDLHLYEYGADGVWRAEQTFPFGVR